MVAGLDQVLPELTSTSARRLLPAALSLALIACDRPAEKSRGAVSSDTLQPAGVVDSALPAEEALRRFRVGLVQPKQLDGPTSRDELYRRFAEALHTKDEMALARLSVTRAEYAYLVYPEISISRPPYNQPPDIAWMLALNASRSGYSKLLGRADSFTLRGYECSTPPEREGAVAFWRCTMDVVYQGQSRRMRLFGAVVERDGRFKIATFDNDL